MINQKLESIYNFLIANRIYNKELQTRYYQSIIDTNASTHKKVERLLFEIINTQSQPSIDRMAMFFKLIHQDLQALSSFTGLMDLLSKDSSRNYNGLFEGLKQQSGWGPKTAALFVKTMYHLHYGDYPRELRIWDDAPAALGKDDEFYLPVDSVMIAIFQRIEPGKRWDFDKINREIRKNYAGAEIEIWDDLWFWGFITQSGSGQEGRTFGWNENKYWARLDTDKDFAMIQVIKKKADEFLEIISECT